MKHIILAIALSVGFSAQIMAQAATAYTVAAFPASAANPATATPIMPPVTYTLAQITCNQTKANETLPIINPYEGRIDDPANPTTRDCAFPIEAQFLALPVGLGYKAAYRPIVGTNPGPWSGFTTSFAIEAAPQTHPCDGLPPTSSTVVAGVRTLSWCWNGLDANGNATTVTAWTAMIDAVRVPLPTVTVGATPNAQGKRLYTASITLAAGSHAVRVAATNAVGEAAFSTTFTVGVLQAATVPSVSEIRGIQ